MHAAFQVIYHSLLIDFYPDPELGGYAVSIPAIDGCYSQGETFEEALVMIMDALYCITDGEMGEVFEDTADDTGV